MLKAALVLTLLGVGAETGAKDGDRIVQVTRAGVQGSINETGRQIVDRQSKVPPTITIRPGFILRVAITRDLVLDQMEGGHQ
jgi:type IV secretion system protein VirB10